MLERPRVVAGDFVVEPGAGQGRHVDRGRWCLLPAWALCGQRFGLADVNLLLPGGATRTGMTPDSAPEDLRATWPDPAVMGPPIVWLASRASNGLTGQRIVAAEFAAHPPS